MGWSKNAPDVKPVEEKKDSMAVEIKLADPIRKLIKEKEAEIGKLKDELNALTAEKKKLFAELKEKEAKMDDLKTKSETLKEELVRALDVPLEELVYVYILGAGGEIAIPHCAQALGVGEEQVKKAITRLIKDGRIAH